MHVLITCKFEKDRINSNGEKVVTPARVPSYKLTLLAIGSDELKKLYPFKSNENIHKKEDWSYYVVSANKASSVTL